MLHQGSCHCGKIAFTVEADFTSGMDCNCSLCRRIAGLWHYCSPAQLTVSGQLTGYVQGDRTLTTWHCGTCGCATHWTAIDPAYDKVGVNLRMFEPALWQDLPRRLVDGASY